MEKETADRLLRAFGAVTALLIVSHSAIFSALAGTCKDSPAIDLTLEEPLLSMKPFLQSGNPATGQAGRVPGAQDTGLCFAVTASQMIDIVRWKSDTSHDPAGPASPVSGATVVQTSPLYAAALYPSVLAEAMLTAASTGSASMTESCGNELRNLQKNPGNPIPSCLSAQFQTDLFMTGGVACPLLNRLKSRASCAISGEWLVDSGSAYELQNALLLAEILPAAHRSIDDLLGPGATCDPLDRSGGISFRDAEIRRSILESCNSPVSTKALASMNCQSRRFSGSNSALSAIEREVEKGYPASLGVCLNLFRQNPAEPGATIISNGQLAPAPGCMKHALLAVGRRWNATNGKCEYKLRDSYPRGSDPAHPTDIWVDGALLGKNLYSVDSISGLP